MPALQANPELLIASFLREAKDDRTVDEAIAWTRALQRNYFTAWQPGDDYASSIASDGSSTAWLREIPANIGAQLCERVLQALEKEKAVADAGLTGNPSEGVYRGFDFSKDSSTLG